MAADAADHVPAAGGNHLQPGPAGYRRGLRRKPRAGLADAFRLLYRLRRRRGAVGLAERPPGPPARHAAGAGLLWSGFGAGADCHRLQHAAVGSRGRCPGRGRRLGGGADHVARQLRLHPAGPRVLGDRDGLGGQPGARPDQRRLAGQRLRPPGRVYRAIGAGRPAAGAHSLDSAGNPPGQYRAARYGQAGQTHGGRWRALAQRHAGGAVQYHDLQLLQSGAVPVRCCPGWLPGCCANQPGSCCRWPA